jgi:type 1 glutamine amidotransferase
MVEDQCMLRFLGLLLTASSLLSSEPIRALIIDGQNNHDWKTTTPVLKRYLEETGLFKVDVATTPPIGSDMSGFLPDLKSYRVVISNYNGDSWPAEMNQQFERFVREGGGFVSYHAANNAFPEWREYNEMIALGGWGGRTEKSGPYARWREGKLVMENKPGPGGHHGKRHEFVVVIRNPSHPITEGLPEEWKHTADELYDSLRGPAKKIDLLATAYSDPATSGSGEHEPILFTIPYGKGRVFHTTLGHDLVALQCVGFITTFQRGTEWATTGKVTVKVPSDFPTAERSRARRYETVSAGKPQQAP